MNTKRKQLKMVGMKGSRINKRWKIVVIFKWVEA